MDISNLLLSFCEIDGISGKEEKINKFVKDKLKDYAKKISTTPLKSIIGEISSKEQNKLSVAIEAHIDSVGLVVQSIEKNGFLKILNCGGLDPKVLISQEVTVLGKKRFKGIICKSKTTDNSKEEIKIDDLLVDLNSDDTTVKTNISVGDPITFNFNPIFLKNDRICVRSLDDRASLAAIFLILDKLKKVNLNCDVITIFSSLEETSQGGVKTAAYIKKPDIAISIDVSFAKSLNCEEKTVGEMGKGPLIGISPILDSELTKKLKEIAKKNKIPHQFEIMNSLTHTNADELAIAKDGVRTCLCSIPIKNMHTPVEIIDLKDIENTVKLIYEFIISIGKV